MSRVVTYLLAPRRLRRMRKDDSLEATRDEVLGHLTELDRASAETLVDRLLRSHNIDLHERLFAEAEKFSKGAFVDGLHYAADLIRYPRPGVTPGAPS
jgi:hypothetical protein